MYIIERYYLRYYQPNLFKEMVIYTKYIYFGIV